MQSGAEEPLGNRVRWDVLIAAHDTDGDDCPLCEELASTAWVVRELLEDVTSEDVVDWAESQIDGSFLEGDEAESWRAAIHELRRGREVTQDERRQVIEWRLAEVDRGDEVEWATPIDLTTGPGGAIQISRRVSDFMGYSNFPIATVPDRAALGRWLDENIGWF